MARAPPPFSYMPMAFRAFPPLMWMAFHKRKLKDCFAITLAQPGVGYISFHIQQFIIYIIILDSGAPNSKSDVLVPWDSLNTSTQSDILDNPLPFMNFKSLDPARASADDIFGTLQTILTEQDKGERPLQFLADQETMYILSTVNSSPVKPSHANRKKSHGRRTIQSDDELVDFSPTVPSGFVAPLVPVPVPEAVGK